MSEILRQTLAGCAHDGELDLRRLMEFVGERAKTSIFSSRLIEEAALAYGWPPDRRYEEMADKLNQHLSEVAGWPKGVFRGQTYRESLYFYPFSA